VHPETGNIYIGSLDHKLYALRPDLSDLFPPVNLGSPIYSSAALSADGSTIYVPTDRGQLHALDALDGHERPGFPFFAGVANRFKLAAYAPVVDGAGTIFFGGLDHHVRALAPDGHVRWDREIGGRPATATIVPGGLIVPTVDGDLSLYRFCPAPVGPPGGEAVCGFAP
jgi:outer membrane protein assembly factor BamB